MKIVRHIPNSITSMNLLFGVMGVIYTFKGNFETAFLLMLAAAVCDFCDGLSARLLNAYSDVGKELDSLADMVSFGLLPSLMLHRLMATIGSESFLSYIPLIIAVLSALRLAKFNVDERQTDNFIGLATPACAMICYKFNNTRPASGQRNTYVLNEIQEEHKKRYSDSQTEGRFCRCHICQLSARRPSWTELVVHRIAYLRFIHSHECR